MAATEAYRVACGSRVDSSEEEEGELSSGDDAPEWGEKRQKFSETIDDANHSNTAKKLQRTRRKPNNIWGSVLADQSSNDITNELGVVGMKNFMSRGPESFSLELAIKEKNKGMYFSSSEDESSSVKITRTETLEEEMENYMIERHHISRKTNSKRSGTNNLKRKRPKKSKQGSVPAYQMGQRVTLNRRNEVSANDSEDIVAEEITFRLWEKKKDLIKALVRTIGVPKSLFLYNKTEALELSGGIMTKQGNRRRTPGGTFLYLLRSDSEIDQDEVNKVFEADYLREREQWLRSKKSKKGGKDVSLNVGETPQNSPHHMDTLPLGTPESNNSQQACAAVEDEMDGIDRNDSPDFIELTDTFG